MGGLESERGGGGVEQEDLREGSFVGFTHLERRRRSEGVSESVGRRLRKEREGMVDMTLRSRQNDDT